jgi:hypothetical protein
VIPREQHGHVGDAASVYAVTRPAALSPIRSSLPVMLPFRRRSLPLHPPHARHRHPDPGITASVVHLSAPHEGQIMNRRVPPCVVPQGTSTRRTSAANPSDSRWTIGVSRQRFGPSSTLSRAVEVLVSSSVYHRLLGLTGAPPRRSRWSLLLTQVLGESGRTPPEAARAIRDTASSPK